MKNDSNCDKYATQRIKQQESNWDKYVAQWIKQQEEEDDNIQKGIPGWYRGGYWDWSCGEFRIVETIHSDNTLYYPD